MSNTPGSRVVLAGQALAAGPGSADLYPLTRTLFVDSGTTTPAGQQDGQEWTPFDSETKLNAAILAMPANALVACVIRRGSGANFSLPPNRLIVLRNEVRYPSLGVITWTVEGSATSFLVLRNVGCTGVTIADGAAPASPAVLVLESASVFGPIAQTGTSLVHCVAGGSVPNFFTPLPSISAQIDGDVDISGYLACLNTEFGASCTQITCGAFRSQGSSGDFDLEVTGADAEVLRHTFRGAKTITFNPGPGTVSLDSQSTRSYRSAGMAVSAGVLIPYAELHLGPLDVDDGPTEGALYFLSSTRQVQYASATAIDEVQAVGVYANLPGYVLGVDGLEVPVLLEAGLTLGPGDSIYVSATTPGRGTNVPPSGAGQFILSVGQVLDATGYSGAEGLVPVLWSRGEVVRQEQQLLGRLASGSNWFNGDAIGLGTANNSQTLDAAGAWTADRPGSLSRFSLRIEQVLGGACDFELYVKPFATGVWAATGIVLSLGAADLFAEEDATALSVVRFDQVALVNIGGGAVFPGATVFSGLLT